MGHQPMQKRLRLRPLRRRSRATSGSVWFRRSNFAWTNARAAASKLNRKGWGCLNESSLSGNVWSDTGTVQVRAQALRADADEQPAEARPVDVKKLQQGARALPV